MIFKNFQPYGFFCVVFRVRYIEEGTRLPCPDGCPATVYSEVMKPCWLKDARNRPSFTDLKTAITKAELKVT